MNVSPVRGVVRVLSTAVVAVGQVCGHPEGWERHGSEHRRIPDRTGCTAGGRGCPRAAL